MPFFALSLVDARRTSEIIKVANSRAAPTVAKHLPVAIATRSATLIITNGGSASAQEISLSETGTTHSGGSVTVSPGTLPFGNVNVGLQEHLADHHDFEYEINLRQSDGRVGITSKTGAEVRSQERSDIQVKASRSTGATAFVIIPRAGINEILVIVVSPSLSLAALLASTQEEGKVRL